jgi:3-oxoacyl-[acyl-carrier protein] reductase
MGVALVTGGSRGIGRATVLALSAAGHQVAAAYVSREPDAGDFAVQGDLRDPAACLRVVEETEVALGPIDILVANAGVGSPPRTLGEISLSEWDELLEVNLRAPFLLAQRVLPGMVARGFGRIVFVSSVAAYTGGVIGAHYAASKAGLHGLCHKISAEAAGSGVTANVVAPALIETDMLPGGGSSPVPVGRFGTAEEVADLIAAVVANAYLTNQSILLDGGWHPT